MCNIVINLRAMASQITGAPMVYSTVCSGADQRKHRSSASLAFVMESPVTGEFPAQRTSNPENVSIWWRHHGSYQHGLHGYWHFVRGIYRYQWILHWKVQWCIALMLSIMLILTTGWTRNCVAGGWIHHFAHVRSLYFICLRCHEHPSLLDLAPSRVSNILTHYLLSFSHGT